MPFSPWNLDKKYKSFVWLQLPSCFSLFITIMLFYTGGLIEFRLLTKREGGSKGCGFLEFDNVASQQVCYVRHVIITPSLSTDSLTSQVT